MSEDSTMIAIVGMACRFPGARDLDQFWSNLRNGVDSISRFTLEQLVAAGVDPGLARHPDYVPARGILENAECFDWRFFGYSPAEASTIDPQQRLMLECASQALDDAGLDPQRYKGWIGVFAGCDFASSSFDSAEPDAALRFLGHEKDFLATRVAYKLGLHGPAVTIQTACSTSLATVHYACQSLLAYECDAALAGGASAFLPQAAGHLYREGDIYSIDGTCRPFDAEASGTVASSGVGVVVLKRLRDALKENDRIIAIVRGSAINNDGSEKVGYTAPSVNGQRDVIRLAMAQARVNAEDIGHIEAHGTGTRVGDPVEVAALTAAFRESTDKTGYCWLSGVKSNIGHAGAAAGIAGFIKTACMLERRELVPLAHFKKPNPLIEFETTPFQICTRAIPWQQAGPVLAGVSSFGMGGTNVHAVLESPLQAPARREQSGPLVFCMSAATPETLEKFRSSLPARVELERYRCADVAWTLALGRRQYPHRQAVVASDARQLAALLHAPGVVAQAGNGTKAVFLFPGQGTLRPGAGRAAYQLLSTFRSVFDEICGMAHERFGVDLTVAMAPDTDPLWLRDTEHQQLGLFALGYALAAQVRQWGISPVAMLGHSIGEYVAAAVAGVWSLPDALALIRERGRAMRETLPGRMLAVAAQTSRVAEFLSQDRGLALAVDAPDQAVISGSPQAIEALCAKLQGIQISYRTLDTERAFHSPFMEPALERLRRAIAATPSHAPAFPVVSNLTGEWVTESQLKSPDYWAEQLCHPVRLTAGIETVLASSPSIIFELGPGESMIAAVRRHQSWNGRALTVPTLGRSPEIEHERILNMAARLWERQTDFDLGPFFAESDARRCSLPPHPFEARSCDSVRRKPKKHPVADLPEQTGLTWMSWKEVGGTHGLERYDCLLRVGELPDGMEEFIASLTRRSEDSPARDLHAALDLGELRQAMDHLSRRPATNACILIMLPENLGPEVLEIAGLALEHVAKTRASLMLLGRRLLDFLGTEHTHPLALKMIAIVEHKLRVSPQSALCLLDLGTGAFPARPPMSKAPEGFFAWRGRRWWKHSPEPLLASNGQSQSASFAPLAVLGSGTSLIDLASRLAREGVEVGAVIDINLVEDRKMPLPEKLALKLPRQASSGSLSSCPDLRSKLEDYAAGLIAQFVMNQAQLQPGQTIGKDTLRSRIDPAARFSRFVDFFLVTLAAQGWLLHENGAFRVSKEIGSGIAAALGQQGKLQETAGVCRLLRHCAESYPAVFTGRQQPISVLYPDGNESLLRNNLEQNQVTIGDAAPCLDALVRLVRDLHRSRGGRGLRILEVGAGHGELSWRLLADWSEREGVSYHFTDISPLLVRRAQKWAAERRLDGIEFSTFDITKEPAEQGFVPGAFDLILAYNVVHVAPDLQSVLRRLGRLLTPNGWLCLVEVNQVPTWVQMVWGLASGWWDFKDELRCGSPHLDASQWKHVLDDAGFNHVISFSPGQEADHVLLIAAEAMEETGSPSERYGREVRRQSPERRCGGALYFPHIESSPSASLDEEKEVVQPWLELQKSSVWEHLRNTWVITEDPQEAGWRGQWMRRRLDPATSGEVPRWRHLEVPDLRTMESAELKELLWRPGLPAVMRLNSGKLNGAANELHRAEHEKTDRHEIATPEPELEESRPEDDLSRALAEVWCEVLGVPNVLESDNFFTTGGESLMAIHFVARARDRLGIRIAVPAFLSQPTFGNLLELGRQSRLEQSPKQAAVNKPTNRPANLVVFHEGGAGLPLFLAAPAAGSSLCYRQLTGMLGDERPCYGLESPGLHESRKPFSQIEKIAAHHVELLLSVRPDGPYVLGGWSTGTIVAHEMACQLEARGKKVGLLLGIEGYVPNTHGWPIFTVPSYLLFSMWDRLQAALGKHWTTALSRTVELSGDEAKTKQLSPRVAEGNSIGSNSEDAARSETNFAGVYSASLQAMLRYVPRPISCRAVIFSTWDASRRARLKRRLAPLYRRGLEIMAASGDHWTILDRPQVEPLAADLKAVLADLTSYFTPQAEHPPAEELVGAGR
jgi:acyl transferase domain-containing protein/thioesterase domain-containing protein/SAM-dependent methyltransferase